MHIYLAQCRQCGAIVGRLALKQDDPALRLDDLTVFEKEWIPRNCDVLGMYVRDDDPVIGKGVAECEHIARKAEPIKIDQLNYFSQPDPVPNEAAIQTVTRLLNKIEDQWSELSDLGLVNVTLQADNERLRSIIQKVRYTVVHSSIDTMSGGDICMLIDAALEILPFDGSKEEPNVDTENKS